MAVSLRAFGRMIGVSGEAVRKAIATGRIPAAAVGQQTRGKKASPVIINPDLAARGWHENTNPAMSHQAGVRRADQAPPGDQQAPPEPPAAGLSAFNRAKTMREAYAAKLAQLEYEEKTGELIRRNEVKVALFNAARQARDRLMQIPDRHAAQLAHEKDQHTVSMILTEEIITALNELADEFARITDNSPAPG